MFLLGCGPAVPLIPQQAQPPWRTRSFVALSLHHARDHFQIKFYGPYLRLRHWSNGILNGTDLICVRLAFSVKMLFSSNYQIMNSGSFILIFVCQKSIVLLPGDSKNACAGPAAATCAQNPGQTEPGPDRTPGPDRARARQNPSCVQTGSPAPRQGTRARSWHPGLQGGGEWTRALGRAENKLGALDPETPPRGESHPPERAQGQHSGSASGH